MKTKIYSSIIFAMLLNSFLYSQVSEKWIAYYWPYGNYQFLFKAITTDNAGNVFVTGYRVNTIGNDDIITVKYNNSGVTQWAVTYNGPGNGSDIAVSIKTDVSGNVYVTGSSYGGSQSNLDYATLKYNTYGTLLWEARYNGPGSYVDQAEKITVDAYGNVIVTGRSFNAGNTNEDYLTVKYNSAGAQLWSARYNGPINGNDYPLDLINDNSGNIYVTGYSIGYNTYRDYTTIKYNSSGTQTWVSRYNGTGNRDDVAKSIAVDNSGNVYVTGWSSGSGSIYDTDALTIKYNGSGSQLWIARYNAPLNSQYQAGYSVAVDASGSVFVGGIDDGFLCLRYNSSGVQQWVSRYSGPANYNEDFTKMVIDNNSNVYITGWSWASSSDIDIATVKYNSSGSQLWRIRKNLGSYDRVEGIALDIYGNVNITGAYGSVGGNSVWGGHTIQYSQNSRLGKIESELPEEYLLHQNYPNPFNPETIIRFEVPNESNVKIDIFNSVGQKVTELVNENYSTGVYEVNWDASEYSSGVYYFRITAGVFTDTKKMMFIK